MNFSEKKYINGVTSFCYSIINMILLVAYILEFTSGQRGIGYILIVAAFTIIPTVLCWFFYKKMPESTMCKHVMGYSYGAFYLFIVFTSDSILTYVYAFPMFMVITLFCDVAYCAKIGGGAFLGNVIDIAIRMSNGEMDATQLKVRVAAVFITCAYMILTGIANNKVNTHKVAVIEDEKEKTEKMLSDTLAISEHITEGIVEAKAKMDVLGESVSHIKDSMKEVSQGSTETADAVQGQLERTEEIQTHIRNVKDAAAGINEDMSEASKLVVDGKKNIETMGAEVVKSQEANETVIEKMRELSEFTAQMNSIIEMINSITNKTALLALNASIEAARAGEAGKGFAVVAGEISTLANQTKNATINITELIDNINVELTNVSEAIDLVTGCNEAHAVIAKEVEESFNAISEQTDRISAETKRMGEAVTELETANTFIVESIQTISAITEEVSAHSNETASECEENQHMVQEVSDIVAMLNEEAGKLTF